MTLCTAVSVGSDEIGYRPNPERHGSVFWFTTRLKSFQFGGVVSTTTDGTMIPCAAANVGSDGLDAGDFLDYEDAGADMKSKEEEE
ncbi:hypothetical protein B0T20DRAFT_477493 [Sordaria brevicollis]|uniref:Uncharacterized protein n=1 Tax=Sordaria brevicollis TaxID=83679 RepID=A0AAE0UDP9_SORBR|nr:hypothetical protein B0T20DRAFT_477493 [Sordaria brevicollis]